MAATAFNEDIINHYSLAERVANLLRVSILKGELKSGTKLTESKISKQYHTSATPVREAFRILQSEGLLEHNPYSGVTVAHLTPKYIIDLSDMRCLLETGACDMLFENIDEQDIRALDDVIRAVHALNPDEIKAEDADMVDLFNSTESEFHIALARATKNVELLNVAKSLIKKAYLSRHMLVLTFSQTVNIHETVKEIEVILEAIKKRDKESYKAAIAQHYQRVKDPLIIIAEEDAKRKS